MAVRYVLIDSELVSAEWHSFLSAARKALVDFRVNEGHRTMARQWWFYRCMQTRRCNNGNLAAFPSPRAPHIRTGRIDHAIDVNGSDALIAYGRRVGVTLTRTVRGESWHLEASAAELRAFHGKSADPLTARERRLVDELARIRRQHGKTWNRAEKARAEEIKAWIRSQRRRIKDEAGRTGWDKANRRARSKALAAAHEGRAR